MTPPPKMFKQAVLLLKTSSKILDKASRQISILYSQQSSKKVDMTFAMSDESFLFPKTSMWIDFPALPMKSYV